MARVEYSPSKRRHEVVLRLDPDEAENIAHALGSRDGAYSELLAAADRCRQLDEEADR